MPTENRSSNTDGWIACDDGLHLIQMDKNLSHYGWVFRKVDGGLPYSVREATSHEMAHAQARQHLRIGVAQIAGQAPAPHAHPEPASYPPCDYCGTVPSYHPWHGSGMINGVENRHIHACDGCRWQLPSYAGQPHPDPIAWMVGTAFWWTKEDVERDAAETGLPIVGLGPMALAASAQQRQGDPVAWLDPSAGLSWLVDRMTIAPGTKLYTLADPAEVERLRANAGRHKLEMDAACGEMDILRAQLAEAQALLRKVREFGWTNVAPEERARVRAEVRDHLSTSAEPQVKS
ncbi:hypothetical protein D884_03214 [Pseudomonas sp. URMO17WK12:I10]|uniref:hypothetical protein n=1 Tax=unclassified Pseudomonas TaxID=196821 RepID=UPI000489E8EE|nr:MULTISPECIES: hypothetical protein [unclassified Pseudomonas]RDL17035.1 hypothetical protein F633_03448 [Pseudomonas sp. LAMO17WK12:I3]RED05103.1 hypothetical protein D884_03214 [Pseudomonas sp. URMO17WK12:I10]SOD08489.1 hypothetical protein SAMN05660967_01698 [Pseudomonas sp. URMO17WK12:I9]